MKATLITLALGALAVGVWLAGTRVGVFGPLGTRVG